MEKISFIILVLTLTFPDATVLASPCSLGFAAPGDAIHMRTVLAYGDFAAAEVKRDKGQAQALEEKLQVLGLARLKEIFPEINPPANFKGEPDYPWIAEGYVLPSWGKKEINFNGFARAPGSDAKYRAYFLKMGDAGGLLLYCYERKGKESEVLGLAITLKQDNGFVPLNKESDYPDRHEWELKKMKELQKFIDAAVARGAVQ